MTNFAFKKPHEAFGQDGMKRFENNGMELSWEMLK